MNDTIVARFAGFFEQCFRSRWAGDVQGKTLTSDFLHQALEVCRTLGAVNTEDFSAVGGQDFSGRSADAACCSSDDIAATGHQAWATLIRAVDDEVRMGYA